MALFFRHFCLESTRDSILEWGKGGVVSLGLGLGRFLLLIRVTGITLPVVGLNLLVGWLVSQDAGRYRQDRSLLNCQPGEEEVKGEDV